MRRRVLAVLATTVIMMGVGYVVAARTYWADVTVPLPLKGEARTNPFYAAERFVAAVGAHATRDRLFTPPPRNAVVVLSNWNWNLSAPRRDALQRWVESGGRLVVDETMAGGREFAEWSGLGFGDHDRKVGAPADGHCARFDEIQGPPPVRSERTRWLCDFGISTFITSTRGMQWALSGTPFGWQAIRVAVGRGSVTLINARPFEYRAIFDGDHAWLLVAAAQLRRGDDVHFLSEADYPSLLALVWQYGAPVVWLALTALGLLLWREAIRFGPPAPQAALVRRSLREQIRGTGQFTLQHDGGESLHAATVHALDDAARRRVPGYGALAAPDRTPAVAEAAGVSADTLADALNFPGPRRFFAAVARLETVRRSILRRPTRT